MYGTSVSASFISEITDHPALKDWQFYLLEAVYSIIWLDAMYYHIRENGKIQTRSFYSVLAINFGDKKEVIACYIGH